MTRTPDGFYLGDDYLPVFPFHHSRRHVGGAYEALRDAGLWKAQTSGLAEPGSLSVMVPQATGYPLRQMPPRQCDWLDSISAVEFRRRTGMNSVTAWRWENRMVKAGKLHPKRFGRLKYYPVSEIREWFDAGGDEAETIPDAFVARAEKLRRSAAS